MVCGRSGRGCCCCCWRGFSCPIDRVHLGARGWHKRYIYRTLFKVINSSLNCNSSLNANAGKGEVFCAKPYRQLAPAVSNCWFYVYSSSLISFKQINLENELYKWTKGPPYQQSTTNNSIDLNRTRDVGIPSSSPFWFFSHDTRPVHQPKRKAICLNGHE